jgi:hypothetical protein
MSIQDSIIPGVLSTKPKVCIAVPTRDTVYAHFSYCLQDLVKYNTVMGIDTFVEFNMGTLIGNQREKLATTAIDQNATHILWLDSDMMFPKNVCEILLGHDLPFVACNYSTRALPLKSVSYTEIFNWQSMIEDNSEGLVLVEGVGFGCVLTSTELFRESRKPWFPITYSKSTNDYLGEDMNFCLKVSEMGFPMFVDADLSKEIYHIGTTAFSWNKKPVDNM